MDEQQQTFKFDELFELKLLAFLVCNVKFYLRVVFVMREDYFTNQIYRDIYRSVSRYADKYNAGITQEVLRNEITKMFYAQKKKDIEIDAYLDVITKLFLMELKEEEYTEDTVLNFARNQEMIKVLKDGAKRTLNYQDLKPILVGVTKALTIGSKLELGYDYFEETSVRASRGYEIKENVVSTGYKRLDRFLGGGLAGGDIGILVGPSSRGKTAGLVNLAVGGLMARKNVIYIALEGRANPEDDIAIRLDMRISRVHKDFLIKESNNVRDSVLYFSRLFRKKLTGEPVKLILKSFPTESVTVHEIDQYITHEEIIRDFKPDLIIIDYLNLCKKSNPKEDNWLGTNYREGKSLAVRRNVPLWSAAQGKDGSLTAKLVEPKHISEATVRIWSDSDVILGLCQNEEEAAETPMKIRWFLGKNKNNEAKKEIPMTFDKYNMLMEEVPLVVAD